MRDFINSILSFIGSTSLTDSEYISMDLTNQLANVYTTQLYTEIGKVLLAREAISSVTDRLQNLFLAKGVTVTPVAKGASNILIGCAL